MVKEVAARPGNGEYCLHPSKAGGSCSAPNDACRDRDREGSDDEEEEENEDEELGTYDGISVPGIAVWYRNAALRKLWANASPEQRNAVERRKMKEKRGVKSGPSGDMELNSDVDGDSEQGGDTGNLREQKLEDIIRFVLISSG
jgi:hypothetical protein